MLLTYFVTSQLILNRCKPTGFAKQLQIYFRAAFCWLICTFVHLILLLNLLLFQRNSSVVSYQSKELIQSSFSLNSGKTYLKFHRKSIFFSMGTGVMEYVSYFMRIWGGNIEKSCNEYVPVINKQRWTSKVVLGKKGNIYFFFFYCLHSADLISQ